MSVSSTITALLRDTQRVVRIALRVAFYLTPVIYSIHSSRAEQVREVLTLNPMTGVLELYRSGLFSQELHVGAVLWSVAVTVVLLVVGSVVFSRLESAVLKEL